MKSLMIKIVLADHFCFVGWLFGFNQYAGIAFRVAAIVDHKVGAVFGVDVKLWLIKCISEEITKVVFNVLF